MASGRRVRIERQLGAFLRQYGRRGRTNADSNDRTYDRVLEAKLKRLPAEELDRILRDESHEVGTLAASTGERLRQELEAFGCFIAQRYIDASTCSQLARSLPRVHSARGGVRNLLQDASVRSFIRSREISALIGSFITEAPVAIKATLLDKTPTSNWKVPWHQDRIVPVSGRVSAAGFSLWSTKGGVLSVEPPTAVLESIIALRIHIDGCPETSGPLRVVPESHRFGRLSVDQIAAIVASARAVALPVSRGSIVGMRHCCFTRHPFRLCP